MRLGSIVRTVDEARAAADLALDHLEVKGDLLCVEPADERALVADLLAVGLPWVAMTSPLPRRLGCRVVGRDADPVRALAVLTRMCDLAAALGVEVVVLGSGQARSYGQHWAARDAAAQLAAFVHDAAQVCAARGQVLAVEPLHRGETDHVNSCAEAAALLKAAQPATAGITIDLWHVVTEELDVAEEVRGAGGAVVHAHTSFLPRGSSELRPSVQARFVSALRSQGYDGALTIEDDLVAAEAAVPGTLARWRDILVATHALGERT